MAYVLNPTTQETETRRSLSSRSVLEQVVRQQSLGSEGSYQNQKDGEDVVEQGDIFKTQKAVELKSFNQVVLVL